MEINRGEYAAKEIMKLIYQLFVDGIPKAQPRPRMTTCGHVFNPESADTWKEQIRMRFIDCQQPVITGAVYLSVTFFMPIPKRMKISTDEFVPHIKKPDTDNLVKAVMDALTQAGVWKDDAQVYSIEAVKGYASGRVGAMIRIFQDE